MALTHLVDTSVLTRLGRGPVRAALASLATAGQVARAGISDLEVGFSARNLGEWTRMASALAEFPLLETDAAHVRARQVQRLLASRGLRGRKVPELLVAAAAETSGLAVLHNDADFDVISRVTGQPSAWVVPAGTSGFGQQPRSRRELLGRRRRRFWVGSGYCWSGVRAVVSRVAPPGLAAPRTLSCRALHR